MMTLCMYTILLYTLGQEDAFSNNNSNNNNNNNNSVVCRGRVAMCVHASCMHAELEDDRATYQNFRKRVFPFYD